MRWLFRNGGGPSYSQCGEDRIIKFILDTLGKRRPAYFDIGAHDPVKISNTYLFYRLGCRGVCVEPNPKLFSRLKLLRPRDICLNVGVGAKHVARAPFYELDSPALSTFSEKDAQRYVDNHGKNIVRVTDTPILTPQEIIDKHFHGAPDFISIDVEGLEFEILNALDLSGDRPAVLCVETLTYSTDGTGEKLTDVIDFLEQMDYMSYADTYINTIFVDRSRWLRNA